MIVNVRLFASLRERAGEGSIDLELDDGATVADALERIAERSSLSTLLDRLPVQTAVNREYAPRQTQLHAGDELALIPPVSGGSPEVHASVTDAPLSVERLTQLVGNPAAGAIVTFQGVTREVPLLDYEAYGEMAELQIRRILEQCLVSHELTAAAAEHRIGEVALGEPGVVVAVSAAHREQAFAGAREGIDRIKADAPIWKREIDANGQARRVEG